MLTLDADKPKFLIDSALFVAVIRHLCDGIGNGHFFFTKSLFSSPGQLSVPRVASSSVLVVAERAGVSRHKSTVATNLWYYVCQINIISLTHIRFGLLFFSMIVLCSFQVFGQCVFIYFINNFL